MSFSGFCKVTSFGGPMRHYISLQLLNGPQLIMLEKMRIIIEAAERPWPKRCYY